MAEPGANSKVYPVAFHTWPERLWVYRYLPEKGAGGDPCLGSTDRPLPLELKEEQWSDSWLIYFVYSPGAPPSSTRAPEIAHMLKVKPGELAGWGRYPQVGELTVYLSPAQRWAFYRDRYGLWGVGGALGCGIVGLVWRRRRPVAVEPVLGEDLQPGDRLAGYLVLSQIGQGASATVYRVQDAQGREFALKRFRWDGELRARFRREMQALAQLNHPHLPFLQDYGEHQDRLYLVMELLGETNLKGLLAQGPLKPGKALEFFRQLTSVLATVHARGITHRDVKPENVVFGRDQKLRLTDFGLARGQDATTITVEGTLLGTPAYMAPELMDGQPTSPCTDQYSLGCLVYELFTGRPPFLGESPIAVAVQHVHSEVPQPDGLDPGLWAILQRMLAKEPEQRYSDLSMLLEELKTIEETDQR